MCKLHLPTYEWKKYDDDDAKQYKFRIPVWYVRSHAWQDIVRWLVLERVGLSWQDHHATASDWCRTNVAEGYTVETHTNKSLHGLTPPYLSQDRQLVNEMAQVEHQQGPQFSAANFATFRGPVRKIPWLTMAKLFKFRGCPFVNKLSSILCIKFSYWRLALCSVMLATFKENYQSFFLFKSAVCQVELCLFIIACRTAMPVELIFKQVSLIFSIYLVTLWSQLSYWSSVIAQFLQNSMKFHGNIKIPRKRANS